MKNSVKLALPLLAVATIGCSGGRYISADKDLEELVRIYQAGEFPALYWSVFWEDPPKVEIPEKYLK